MSAERAGPQPDWHPLADWHTLQALATDGDRTDPHSCLSSSGNYPRGGLMLNRNIALAGLSLAVLAVPALAGEMTTGAAFQHDHSGKTVLELAAEYAAKNPTRRAYGESVQVPNRLSDARSAVRDRNEADPLLGQQSQAVAASPILSASFDGPDSDNNDAINGGRVRPPDTNGDVGLNDVVSYVNLLYEVRTKGGVRRGLFPGDALFFGFGGPCETDGIGGVGGGAGDYIVLYDEGRWVYKGWAPNFGIECIAITDGEDPLGPVTRYAFQVVPPSTFNDYPKLAVWVSEDGTQSAYTLTIRNFGIGFEISAYLLDRDAIRAGDPAPGFVRQSDLSRGTPDGIMPGHTENLTRAPGGACPLFSVAQAVNGYRFWEFCEDFPNGTASFRSVPTVFVPPFDNGVNDIPQPPPGNPVDSLSLFTAYRAAHTNLNGDHRLVLAHTVDLGGDRAGIRWAILDVNDYDNISLIDTGTFGPNDGLERWMSSATLDRVGNLGIGYTRGGSGDFSSVFVNGREASDPPGTLQTEVECVRGTGADTAGGRWGDYSTVSLDPVDGCTFWAHQEYVQLTGSAQWDTRWCSFSFPSCTGVEPTDYTLLDTVPGEAGISNDFETVNGSPDRNQVLYVGRAAGSTPVTLGVCSTSIGIANARLVSFREDTDGDGGVTFTLDIPPQVEGITLFHQAVDLFECETSNVTSTTY
jgi:hypothetical protein